MNVLITGASGFIGKNLVSKLQDNSKNNIDIFQFDRDTDLELFYNYCKKAEFIYHLAGVNRTINENDFIEGNVHFTAKLLDTLTKYNNKCPILFTSSIQAESNNSYGNSKKEVEKLLIEHSKKTGSKVFIYRLPNVFGKWCRPNYNSAIATFCHNVTRQLPISVNSKTALLNLVYIDDVIDEFTSLLEKIENSMEVFYEIPVTYLVELGEVVNLIYSFYEIRTSKTIPDLSNVFVKKLYATYLSYLPEENFSYRIDKHEDSKGYFAELLKSKSFGQISVNKIKPGITKGNHWHTTKVEKFLVLSGEAIVRFRNLNSAVVSEYSLSGHNLEIIDIPPGYTHNVENIGKDDLIMMIWANEPFNSEKPDTFYLEV